MRLTWSLFVVSLMTNLLKENRLKGTFPVYLKNFSRISFEFPEEFAKTNKRNLKNPVAATEMLLKDVRS